MTEKDRMGDLEAMDVKTPLRRPVEDSGVVLDN